MVAQGIPQGLPKEILKEAVKLQVADEVPLESQALAIEGLSAILQPNLVRDREETKQLAELAAQKVKPVMIAVEQGEIIVAEGQEISQQDFVLLDYFGLSQAGGKLAGAGGFCLFSRGGNCDRTAGGKALPFAPERSFAIAAADFERAGAGEFGAALDEFACDRDFSGRLLRFGSGSDCGGAAVGAAADWLKCGVDSFGG